MSGRVWTKEQEWAIRDRGGTLLLSAAAGSGKTAVLTQRAVELIADEAHPVEADRLLIVTFTNAAAAELRQRMAAALDEKLAARPDSSYLKRQKLRLLRADICTVDSFCINLLTQHFNETELPPDFTLLRTAQEAQMREDALAETLEEMYADEGFRAFASLYGRARDDRAAGEAVLRLYDLTRSMAEPKTYLAGLAKDYEVSTSPADTSWGRLLLARAETVLDGVEKRLAAALDMTEEAEPLAAYRPVLKEDQSAARELREKVQAADWDGCCAAARCLSFTRMPTVTAKKCPGPWRERIGDLRKACKEMLLSLASDCFMTDSREFLAEQAVCLPMVRSLAQASGLFSEKLFAKKAEAKAFGFDDFEHMALELLCRDGQKTPLAQELSEQYAMVMVDEYQDTNDLQDRLYQMLGRADASNLFFVGDVKQSIYGFRDAKPACFLQKRDSYAPYDQLHYPATIPLGQNFRSAPGVIDAVNEIFSRVMRRENGGVDYTKEEYLVAGLPAYALSVAAEVCLVDTSEKPTEGEKRPDDSACVAETIRRMLAEGALVREGAGVRPCRPGDFCILLRSPGSVGRRYADKLDALGIGAFCRAEDELLAAPEVQSLLSFLRVLDNPGQDIHLTAVMLSPLFGFSPDDLAGLRLRHPQGSLYAALLQDEDAGVTAFVEKLRGWRRRSLGLPVQEICGMLLDETGFYHLAGALPGGESCQQNLRAFQGCAAEYAGIGGLSGFLRMVDAAEKNNRPLSGSRQYTAPSDKVQIMSIHASKGLEFPVVILANASRAFNAEASRSNFLCHGEMGVAFRLRVKDTKTLVPTIASRAVTARISLDQADEEMRLLYVALTRAKDRLLIVWDDRSLEKTLRHRALDLYACGGPDAFALQTTGQQGMSHWILLALLNHPDFAALRERIGWNELPVHGKKDCFLGRWVEPTAAEAAEKAAEAVRAEPEKELVEALRENFMTTVPAAPPLPVKVSVSALSHRDRLQELEKPAFLFKEGMNAAQKGTALHTFLQVADLAAAARDPEAEIDRLVREGYLEPEAAARIERTHLRRFLNSPLFARQRTAEKVLREYEFISRVPASMLADSAGAAGTVFLLGIADCLIVNGGEAELVDYKTDHGKTPEQLLAAYTPQLALYKEAVEKRLGVRVARSTLYSFALDREINVLL